MLAPNVTNPPELMALCAELVDRKQFDLYQLLAELCVQYLLRGKGGFGKDSSQPVFKVGHFCGRSVLSESIPVISWQAGLLLGRLWEIIPLIDQLTSSKG